MSQEPIEVHGMIREDGTLELERRLELPVGPVRVAVQPLPTEATPDPARFQALMERIWAGQKVRGHVPRTKEEIDAEIRRLREETEEEAQAVERLHEECQRARQGQRE